MRFFIASLLVATALATSGVLSPEIEELIELDATIGAESTAEYVPPAATDELGGALPSEISPREFTSVDLEENGAGKNELAKNARLCYSVGDPHTQSYDGQIFHFQGVGQMLLSQSSRQTVQARNHVCGKHPYYGAVACYNAAAFRYTIPGGKSDLIEVELSGTLSIKVNGKAVRGNARTPTGVDIYRYTVTSNKIVYPMVAVRTPIGTGANFGAGAIYIFERPGAATKGLCGNNNGDAKDDLKFLGSKRVVTCENAEACVDSDFKKPIHEWGVSWMVVKGGSIPNIFDSSLAGVDKLSVKPEPTHFSSATFKAKAKALCQRIAKSYSFYFDCMFDAAQTGNLDDSRADGEVQNVLADIKKAGRENKGRTQLLDVLSKLDVTLGIQKEDLIEGGAVAARKVRDVRSSVTSFEKVKSKKCYSVRRGRRYVRIAKLSYEKSVGQYQASLRTFNRSSKEWSHLINSNHYQIKTLRRLLENTRHLTETNDIETLPEIDHTQLAEMPDFKDTLTELIERSKKDGIASAKVLIEKILHRLEAESSRAKVSLSNLQKTVDHKELQKRDAHVFYVTERRKLAKYRTVCASAKSQYKQRKAKLSALETFETKDGIARAKQLGDLNDEISMARNLKKSIIQWGKSKRFKKCVSDIEMGENATASDSDEWEKLADSL